MDFDFIIVGAGSAGCVLANRLIQNTPYTVALVEAGRSDEHPVIQIPFGISLITRFKNFNWDYETAPESECGGRQMFWPRGKTLGGSSSVNAMVYIRGDSADYDGWADLCDDQRWSYDNVLPIFKKLENNARGADEYHGIGGELSVSDLEHTDPLSKAWVEACEQAGIEKNADFNAASRYGAGIYQVTTGQGKRCSSARAFLTPIKNNPRFTLFTDTQVNRVVTESEKATGIEVLRNGQVTMLTAQKEVILSAGAINTPKLLMLSGIGDEAQLKQHDIDVVHHSYGVGKNLQDHLDVIVQYKAHRPCGYSPRPSQWGQFIKGIFNYWKNRSGLLTSNVAEAGGFVASRYASKEKPDIQFHFIPAVLLDHGRQTSLDYGFGVHACNLYPFSRGEIQLGSAEPDAAPVIKAGYLTDSRDLEIMQDALRFAQKTLSQPALSHWLAEPLEPARPLSEGDEIAFIKAHSQTIYHPVGTCKMGKKDDPDAVVDSELNVFGIENLRVVDASIMPTIVGGNTNAPTMMIADNAAQMIIKKHMKDASYELTAVSYK